MADDQEIKISIAELRQQIGFVKEVVIEIKQVMNQFAAIKEAVTKHESAIISLQESDQRAAARLDSHSEWQKKHEDRTEQELRRLESLAVGKVEEVWKYSRAGFSELSTFQNRLRGGMWALGFMMTMLGGVCLAGGTWIVGTISDAKLINSTQQQEIAELRRMVTRTEIKVDGK